MSWAKGNEQVDMTKVGRNEECSVESMQANSLMFEQVVAECGYGDGFRILGRGAQRGFG